MGIHRSRVVIRSFNVFFVISLDKSWNKRSSYGCFEMWRGYWNGIIKILLNQIRHFSHNFLGYSMKNSVPSLECHVTTFMRGIEFGVLPYHAKFINSLQKVVCRIWNMSLTRSNSSPLKRASAWAIWLLFVMIRRRAFVFLIFFPIHNPACNSKLQMPRY